MSDVTAELAMEANDKAMEIARLQADNAKLRECLQDLAEHIREDEHPSRQGGRHRRMEQEGQMTEKNGVERSTATEILRRLLDERGVEWDYGIEGPTTTRFTVNGVDLTFTPLRGGLVCSTILTPEQAIAATLGAGTCHPVISDNLTESEGTGDAWADCSECGHLLFVLTDPNSQVPNFCPNCGRRVVQ